MIDYNYTEVVARQNVSPNAGCMIDGVFYDVRNCIHEIANLRAENKRLREALVNIEKKSRLNKVNPDMIWGIAKEALK